MNSLPVSTTLAVFTMASAASIAPTKPFVSISPRASMLPPFCIEHLPYHRTGREGGSQPQRVGEIGRAPKNKKVPSDLIHSLTLRRHARHRVCSQVTRT